MPWPDAVWRADGVDYLQPEIQLLFKARRRRLKDQADFDATVPHLGDRGRAWLRQALTDTEPGHAWIDRLG